MKKKALGFAVLAMTLMASTAAWAVGGVGDIVSIDPCDEYGYKIVSPGANNTLSAGQTAYFRIRLLNVNCRISYNTRNSFKRTSPWLPDYNDLAMTEEQKMAMWASDPPYIGIYVSGSLRYANVLYPNPLGVEQDDDGSWAGWYTDLICSYTVKPGDLALPMTLANANGKEVGNGTSSQYWFKTRAGSSVWRLRADERNGESDADWNTVTETNYCLFAFNNGAVDLPPAYTPEWATDYNLKQAGLYLKSVDYHQLEYSVAQGRTEKVTVDILGGANTNGNGTVYVMTKDLDAIELAENEVETVTITSDPARPLDGTYQVAKVTIPSGDDATEFSFKVKGIEKDKSGTVYLSTTKTFTYGLSGDLVTNFVTAVVKCIAPPPPYITVTIDGAASKSVTPAANYTDYSAKLTVTLSEAYTADMTVNVTPTMASGSSDDPMGKYIGVSTYSENGQGESTKSVSFTAAEMASGTLSKELYIYALGGGDDTDGINKGIKFTPAATGAAASFFNNENVTATLYIKKSTPVVANPVEGYSYTGLSGGVASAFTIKISDSYNDLQHSYDVEWYKTGSGNSQKFTATPNGDGEITVTVKYNAGTYTSRFRVKNASGVWSDMRTISVQVNPAKQVSAVVEDPDGSLKYSEDAEELTIRFKLTEGYDDSKLFAFLVPQDEASSNYVSCTAFTLGVPIPSGDTESAGTATMTILDGNAYTMPLSYDIVLRTEKTWSAGETIGTYESKPLDIYISNKAPVVSAVKMSGSVAVTKSGDTFKGKASAELNKIFKLEAEDVEADLTNNVTSVWSFSDPNGNNVEYTVTAPLDEIVLTNVFEVAGTYDCSVKLQDKDMGKTKYGPDFLFHVIVLEKPSVQIVFPDSEIYSEMAVLNRQNPFFYVDLSTPATKPVDVDLVCTKVGVDGIFNIATNRVSFRANQMRATVNIEELDGTSSSYSTLGGFTLDARVITETVNEDGIPYKDVYLPTTERVFVNNENPKILLPQDTGVTNDAAVNVNLPIKWKIDDVASDLTNGLTVAWTTSEGRYEEFSGSDVSEGVFTNMFTSGGAKTVTITVTDKDGGSSSVTLYYRVAASKRANIYPQGPYYGGGLSAVAKKYVEADGRGRGRVWADATKYVEDFVHRYTYGYTATKADIYAWGYKHGQVDDGTLVDSTGKTGRDIAINGFGDSFANGATFTSADCYKYVDPEGRDSFFYAWVIDSKEEEASSFTGSVLLSPNSPDYPNRFTSYSLSLPEEFAGDDNNPVFPDRYLEAFFSKELYVEDNMGDMNADGIPDYFATKGWPLDAGNSQMICEAMTGQAVSSEGGDEGGGSASDLADVSGYNGDEDFLPKCWSVSGNPLKPAVPNWGPGEKFTALYEIRGVGMSRGLDPDDDHLGLNEPGVSDYDLSSAERYALFAEYVKTGATLTGVLADDYAVATNWATRTRWTPEALNPKTGARLNPLKADTDGDGFDDGWEYFFWYYAKIGAVTNGVWGRLEGRRYDIANPATGTRISSDEIAAAFNPHVVAVGGRDFDGDGLTDFEEYVLGTNPCDWDSDGDGANDLWEVMNGLDPLSPLDGDENPDRDFMARVDYAGDTFTVFTFANGDIFGLPSSTVPKVKIDATAEKVSVFETTLATDETVWFAGTPTTMPQNGSTLLMLAVDTEGYDTFEYDGEKYLGAAHIFPAGTLIKTNANTAVEKSIAYVDGYIPQTSLTDETGGFQWRNPATGDDGYTPRALPLFNYGGDGSTYVPCALTVSDYSFAPVAPDAALVAAAGYELPEGFTRSPLIKVEEKRTITLIHNQVFKQYGFDPRTAWGMDVDNSLYVDRRWGGSKATEQGVSAAGLVTTTSPYTSRDEYLVMQYRQQMRAIKSGARSKTESLLAGGSVYLVDADNTVREAPSVAYFRQATTYPNFPVSFVREAYAAREEKSPFDNSTNDLIVSYWTWLGVDNNIHGADTDADGVPDGWELYVGADPNVSGDGAVDADGDKLTLTEEYAGVDACNAYTNRFLASDPSKMIYPEADTITKNHPGRKSGWWNKFFPTNPENRDTDGDGVADKAEGSGFKTNFSVGNNWYGSTQTSFIYGREENADKYDMDDATICFRGGGLNPCTVDTDGDLLPDGWEYQFAGVIFKDGEPYIDSEGEGWEPRNSDRQVVARADGKQEAVAESGSEIRGGMDGTWGAYNDSNVDRRGDSCFDFDHDGLVNCQEYLVQALRHLRYDDTKTPLMGIDPANTKKFLKFIPFSAWDGESFHKRCLENGFTGLGSWKFGDLGYFTRPPRKWDMLSLNLYGLNCFNYSEAGYRVMLPPSTEIPIVGKIGGAYVSTDPRRWDSDEDGMDDYYELFHGLNPLLGSALYPAGVDDYNWQNVRYDVIASAYGGMPNAWCNFWTDWSDATDEAPSYDAMRHPWMIGTMECDADGDGLRNDEESIKVNLAQPSTTHTDPTPLWMTDSTSVDHASYTSQYYAFDPYITEVEDYDPRISYPDVLAFPWPDMTWFWRLRALGASGESKNWMFSFEENEGYDTDHDFKVDAKELTKGTEMASEPQLFSDPARRQALYLPGLVNGVGSAAASRDGQFRRAVSSEPDLFKQFTVELWVRPDGSAVRNSVLLERVCNYGPSTLSNNTSVLRTNFRLGVDGDGRAYGEFEGSTVDSGHVRVTSPIALEDDEWTHLAFSFNGTDAKFFINGELAPVSAVNGAGLIPANGIYGIQQEYQTPVMEFGYVSLPCATFLGASALNVRAIALDETTTWDDFGSFFKGWIDEVRIWDGARSPQDIHDNYRRRFTMADLKEMRSNEVGSGIFDQWAQGVRRSNMSGQAALPAELIQHYNFTSLPGGIEPQNVITEPSGFTANVTDNVRKPNGRSLDDSLLAGWWSQTPVHSTVYWNYAVVPWIGNMVAHLPFLDGSAPDSQYWSTGLAGVITPDSQGFISYDFPNVANPYPYFLYHRERRNRLDLLGSLVADGTNTANTVPADSLAAKWMFQLRSDFLGTSDLVPLGGAYAKRGIDFWDGQGAMDAWTETSDNGGLSGADEDGVPAWAANLGLTTVQAYLRALAKGLLPDGTYNTAYKAAADENHDGVPDWWQKLYGVTGSAQEDADKDGLADFAEYLISDVFDFDGDDNISPVLPKSNGNEFDYFRRPVLSTGVSKLYLGEMFSDHDFMEDHLEREWSEIGADPGVYDAHLDANENGWSNWAEVRAKYDDGYAIQNNGAIKTNTVYESFYWYDDYKSRLDYLLEESVKTADSATVEVLDTNFDILSYGYWSSWGNWGYVGSGYIQYKKFTPVYAKTYAYIGHPKPLVKMTVRYNGVYDLTGKSLQVQAYTDAELKRPDATFIVANGANRNVNALTFQYPVAGYLREGMNTFVVSVGDSNTTVSVNTIMGVARNVDVGWKGASFEVELTGESPICPRLSTNVSDKDDSSSDSETASTSSHIYVYRYAVDGYVPPSSLDYGPILDKELGSRTILHEGDFLSDADFDIDWSNFERKVLGNWKVVDEGFPVTSVTYRVYFQPVNIDSEAENPTNETPYVEFRREFGTMQATAVPVSPNENSAIVFGGRPTFTWRITGDHPETYTAFAIQVKDASGAVVWTSGTQLAPPRKTNGDYEWTAPIYPGDQTTSGKVFAETGNYTWSVTMYNSKFRADNYRQWNAFRVNVYGENEPNAAGYYGLNAAVKYFGPGTVNADVTKVSGTLRVEAYSTPDFSGEPAGRTYVSNLASLSDANHEVNATIVGLKPGTYYVRAFIDSDGDFKRSDWESWGYACPRGDTETGAIYRPSAVTVGEGLAMPVARVYVEDSDVDQDCLPDVWEYDKKAGNKAGFLSAQNPKENTHNGYIAVNPSLAEAISDLINGSGGTTLRLLAVAPGSLSADVAALMLGVPTVEPSLDTLSITSLTLENGVVKMTLGAEASDPLADTVFVTDGMVRATVVVSYADTLNGEWHSVEKDIEKKIEDGVVSEELSFDLSELGLDASKGFFKVELKK